MQRSALFSWLLALCSLSIAIGEVTVMKTTQYIYDKSPKLRIRGSGFDADDHDIILELSARGGKNLVVDKVIFLTLTEYIGLTLKKYLNFNELPGLFLIGLCHNQGCGWRRSNFKTDG